MYKSAGIAGCCLFISIVFYRCWIGKQGMIRVGGIEDKNKQPRLPQVTPIRTDPLDWGGMAGRAEAHIIFRRNLNKLSLFNLLHERI